MSKRQKKRSFNSRLTRGEVILQKMPTWLIISVGSLAFYLLAIFISDYENQCRKNVAGIAICPKQLMSILFENAETIAILAAVVLYWKEVPDRKDQRHYEAWRVVEQAEGKQTSYSRYKALQDLNDDDVSLKGLDAPEADLKHIHLSEADLSETNLEDIWKLEQATQTSCESTEHESDHGYVNHRFRRFG